MADRLTPKKDTLNKLFALSGNQCAFPGCNQPLLDLKNRFIGQVCHIVAASDGGERGESSLSQEERRQLDNLLILCYPHHIATDDVQEYTISRLREIKLNHEERFRNTPVSFTYPDSVVDEMYSNEMRRLRQEVSQTLENTEILKVGMDKSQHSLDQLNNQFSGLMRQLNANLGGINNDFTAEIDDIIKLRDSNEQKAGIIAISQFRVRNWERLNAHDRFRTVANLGILTLELNDLSAAADYFIEAYGYETENIKAQGIGALGYAIRENDEKAMACIDEIWKSEPENTDAWYAFIMVKRESTPFHELLAIVPDQVRNDAEIAAGLSLAASLSGNHQQSIVWAKVALDNAKANKFDFKASLATCILQSLLKPYELLSGQVSIEDKEKAKYVIALYAEAWEEIKDTGLAKSRAWWLINRGVCRKFLPDAEATYNDMAESCRYNETYYSLRHLAIAALEADKILEAIQVTDRMAEIAAADEQEEIALFRIELLNQNGDQDEALKLLDVFLKGNLKPKNRYHASTRVLDIYEKKGEIGLANPINEKLLAEFPDKILPYVRKGRYSEDESIFRSQLLLASSKVSEQSEPSEVHSLIKWLGRMKEYSKAAELLEGITNQNVLSDHTKELLELYYLAGETDKVLSLTESLLSSYGPTDILTEYKAFIFQAIGDYENAIEACRSYLNIYPDDQLILTRLGMLLDKDGQPEALEKLMDGIERADQTLPRFVQNNLASLFYKIKNYDAYLRIVYESRRQFYEEPEAHKAYTSALLKEIPVSIKGDPNSVKIDDAVSIKIDGAAMETFTIEQRIDAIEIRGELDIEAPLAKLLMGKKINEHLNMPFGNGEKTIEILDIQPKFKHAFNESLKLLTGKFFQQSGAKHFQVGNSGNFLEDFGFFSDMLKEGQRMETIFIELLVKGQITLGSIAMRKNTTVFQVWKDFIEHKEIGVSTSMVLKEHIVSHELIKNGVPLILDTISLITLLKTGTMGDFSLLENKKIITRSTYDEVTVYLNELEKIRERGITHLRLERDEVENRFETPEDIQQEMASLRELINWIAENILVLPADAAIKINAHEKKKYDEMMGLSFVDSALTAESQDGLLVSEERLIRGFWSQKKAVNSSNMASIFEHLKKTGKISQQRYDLIYGQLIRLNFRVIPVEARQLYNYALMENFLPGKLFERSCAGLLSPLIAGNLSIGIAVDFFYLVYANTSGIVAADKILARKTIFRHCIEVLCVRYEPVYLENQLLDLSERKLRLLPLDLDEFRQIIITYFQSD